MLRSPESGGPNWDRDPLVVLDVSWMLGCVRTLFTHVERRRAAVATLVSSELADPAVVKLSNGVIESGLVDIVFGECAAEGGVRHLAARSL